MGSGAGEILVQCVFDGCISMHDMEIQRRPYHRDCKCALHKLEGIRPSSCSQHRRISYPKKQGWAETESSLSTVASKFPPHTSPCNDLSDNKLRKGSLSSRQYKLLIT